MTPGPSGLRALSARQYANTIRDLFGDGGQQPPAFVSEVGTTLVQQQMQASEEIARRAAGDLRKLMGCDPGAAGASCVKSFVTDFGARAFRRPLEAAEVTLYEGLYTRTRAAGDDRLAAELVLQAMLQSPFFLYRPELGERPGPAETAKLTPFELASRLSYFITETMPDAELFRAASGGKLATGEDVARETRRLLAKPQAKEMVARFHEQWLGFAEVTALQKASTPGYTPELRALMREETGQFLDHVAFQGKFTDLVASSFSFMSKPLATFYGLTGPTGAAFQRVNLDPAQRSGVLTHASLMAVNAEASQTHPVLRGKLVRTRFLCEPLPDTPPGLEIKIPELQAGQGARQRWSQHASDPSCNACHKLMDPIGFGFEHYDPVGRWRERDQNLPVDAMGEVIGSDVAGRFNGAIELSKKLAGSRQAQGCVVTQWFRFAFDRLETEADACTLATLTDAFQRSGGHITDMLVALAQSPSFMSRRVSR